MQKAMHTTKIAFDHIASILQPGMHEYEIEAEIARIFRKNHMTEAYPSIVASGPNSCILHYTQLSRQMHRFDILLIDAGAEYRGYASDMTRTFVVG
jgi:Xaa-Pro aminopeptidase